MGEWSAQAAFHQKKAVIKPRSCPMCLGQVLPRRELSENLKFILKILRKSLFWLENIPYSVFSMVFHGILQVTSLVGEISSPLSAEKLLCSYMPFSSCGMNDLVQNESFM